MVFHTQIAHCNVHSQTFPAKITDMTFYTFNAHRRKITCALNVHAVDFRIKIPTLTLKDISLLYEVLLF